jgi:hypothetical protein
VPLFLIFSERYRSLNSLVKASVPVTVRTDGTTLTATGHFEVKQTDYGIKPVSVGGVVSVKNSVNVSFAIVGR